MSHQAHPSRNTSQASQLSVEPHLPTHNAAFRNDVKKLKHLMEEEGAPFLDEESLETPLHVAARWYVTIWWEMHHYLVKQCISIEFNISCCFLNYSGSDAVVKYLLTADHNAVLAKAVNGSTPAHYAAIYGQLSTLKLLLEDGDNRRNDVAEEKDTQGLTVLHLASLKGDEQVIVMMLCSCSMCSANKMITICGITSIYNAVKIIDPVLLLLQVVEYLLVNFRELEDIPNEAEDYPIHFASASGITVLA